jgi:A/G-specific adenine glycosylase
MDLGATICLPKNPRCLICPVMKMCKARINGTQNQRPVMKPKRDVPHYIHAAGVVVRRIGREASPKGDNPPYEEVLLAQRPAKGLLAGMWEFPNGRVNGDPVKELAKTLKKGYNIKLRAERSEPTSERRRSATLLTTVQHAYSHFKVTVYAFQCELKSASQNENLRWIPIKELEDYPMGKIDRQIAKMIAKLGRNKCP